MSTEAAAPARAAAQEPSADLRAARVLRFAVGVAAACAIAFAVAWPLYFLAPVLTAFFLAQPLPAPSPGTVLRLAGHVVGATALALALSLFLLPFPLLFVPALGLALFHLYYRANRGAAPFAVVISLLALLLLPVMSVHHDLLGLAVGLHFAASAVLALLVYLAAHALLPDPPAAVPARSRAAFLQGYSPAAARNASMSTAAILPLATLFLLGGWTGEVLVLVFAAIFSLAPQVSAGKASGLRSLASTLIGGAVALGLHTLLLAAPAYPFFVALMLLAALGFGRGIFSEHRLSGYLPSAMIVVVILLGGSMDAGTSITAKLALRIALLAAATAYVVAVMAVLNRWLGEGRPAGQR